MKCVVRVDAAPPQDVCWVIDKFGAEVSDSRHWGDDYEQNQKLSDGDRQAFSGEVRDILLHFGIQVDFALLDELKDRDGRHGLAIGSESVRRFLTRQRMILQVSVTDALGPQEIILCEAHRETGYSVHLHLGLYEALERLNFGGVRSRWFGGCGKRGGQKNRRPDNE